MSFHRFDLVNNESYDKVLLKAYAQRSSGFRALHFSAFQKLSFNFSNE